jgi:hypothetical protein
VGEFGGGVTFAFFDDALAIFALADTQLLSGPKLDGIRGAPVRVGLGPWGGMRLRWDDRLVTLLTGSFAYLPWNATKTTWSLEMATRWQLGTNVALGIEGRYQPRAAEGQLAYYFYF